MCRGRIYIGMKVGVAHGVTCCINVKKRIKKTDMTSRLTHAGIGHSAPVHRGGHVQNRIRRRQALPG